MEPRQTLVVIRASAGSLSHTIDLANTIPFHPREPREPVCSRAWRARRARVWRGNPREGTAPSEASKRLIGFATHNADACIRSEHRSSPGVGRQQNTTLKSADGRIATLSGSPGNTG